MVNIDREAGLGYAYEEVRSVVPIGTSKSVLNQLPCSCWQYKGFLTSPVAFATHPGFGAANLAVPAEDRATRAAARDPAGPTGLRERMLF